MELNIEILFGYSSGTGQLNFNEFNTVHIQGVSKKTGISVQGSF